MLGQRRSWPFGGRPPKAAFPEPMPDPLQRPAQLLPAPGTRLEGWQLSSRRIAQTIETQSDRYDPRLCGFAVMHGQFPPNNTGVTGT